MNKPPLGIIPRFIWRAQRLEELKATIIRFVEQGCPLLPEWIEEYHELLREYQKEKS